MIYIILFISPLSNQIEKWLKFCYYAESSGYFYFYYHWRAIDTSLVRSIALNMSQQNHFHLMISFSNHHRLYFFVHISSIRAGREVVEDLSSRRNEKIFLFLYNWRAIDTSLIHLIALKTIHILGWTKRSFICPIKNYGEGAIGISH